VGRILRRIRRVLAIRSYAVGDGLRHEELPVPVPEDEEVRLRVAACGVCHTDLHIVESDRVRVTRPVTLGHEIAGWIDDAGDSASAPLAALRLGIGDPVLVFGGWGCGQCELCLTGMEQGCPDRRSPGLKRDGGYASFVIVPNARHLVPLGALDPVRAAPLADAGLTPWRAVRRASQWLNPGANAVVIGVGGLGQFAIQYLKRTEGIRVVACDRDPAKLRIARDLGADAVLDLPWNDGDQVMPAGEARVAFDFVGTDATLAFAAATVGRGGLISLVGEAGGSLPFGFGRMAVESYATTTSWGSLEELRQVVAMAHEGLIHWEVDRLPLSDAAEAHARLAAGHVTGRLVLVPG
jgi:propanol-preferring alcohol dehydrogenase